jgi:hypothetical protein
MNSFLTIVPRFFYALIFFSLVACERPGTPGRADPSQFETEAGEAVLRQVMVDAAIVKDKTKIAILVLGERMDDSTPEFRARFASWGYKFITGSQMSKVWVGNHARVVEKESGLQPLQLQLSQVRRQGDGSEEFSAAWAYGEQMQRRRYVAKKDPSTAAWVVEAKEILEQKPKANQ